jgi:multiple sugar transport system substrate-binding protein
MNKYRVLLLTLSMLTGVTMMTGCSNNKKENKLLDKDNPVTITIWHYYNGVQQTNFDEAIKEFNSTIGLEEGIIAEAYTKNSISELSESVISSLKNDAGAEDSPDIFATYAETAYLADKMDALVDLNQYFTEDELNQYIGEYIDEGDVSGDGTLKIFPTAKSTEVMMINLTDWEEFAKSYDVSTDDLMTWEGVAETAEKYYNYTDALTPDIENDGKAFFGRDSVANYMNIGSKQLGAEFVSKDENNNVVINVDETVVRRLWDNYYVPYVKGYYTAQGRYRSDDAKVGKIIALVCSTTGATYYPSEITLDDDYTYPIENVVLPVPNFEGTDPYIVQQGAGMSVVKSDEKTEYACSVFLKWFTEEERNIEFSVNSGYLPVKKSANDFSKISEVVENENLDINETIQNTLRIAIDEINSYTLYTTISFDKSTELRNYLGNFIQDTADEDYAEICERIESGEKREDVLEEYTNDTAFSNWFAQFKTGLEQTASES